MSEDIQFRVKRNGVVVPGLGDVNPLKGQLDHLSIMEATALGGESPFDTYMLYNLGPRMDIRRGDLVVDAANIDPDTGTYAAYRISGPPEWFPDYHTEIYCQKVVGTPS